MPKQWAAVGACAVLLAVVLFQQSAPPVPAAVLDRANVTAAKLAAEQVHQVFEVNEVQVRPEGPARRSRLELWSDSRSNRFASRWTDSNGLLKHAIWSTGGKSSFVYGGNKLQSISRRKQADAAATFASAEPDLNSVETQFMRWLENRPWKPIVLLADMSVWRSEGAILRVERVSARQLRLTVEREKGVKLQLVALVDAKNSAPQIQKLRLEKAGRIVEFQFSSERTDAQPVFSPAVFYPDRTLLPVQAAGNNSILPVHPLIPLSSHEPEVLLPTGEVAILRHAMDAYYILHLAGACTGAPVTVSQEVEGVRVSSGDSTATSTASYFTKDVGVEEVMGALAEIRRREQGRRSQAAAAPDVGAVTREVDALALLASSFDETKMHSLPASSLGLFKIMVEDHASRLDAALSKLGVPNQLAEQRAPAMRAQNWWGAISALTDSARSLDFSGLVRLQSVAHEAGALFQQTITTGQRIARVRESNKGNR